VGADSGGGHAGLRTLRASFGAFSREGGCGKRVVVDLSRTIRRHRVDVSASPRCHRDAKTPFVSSPSAREPVCHTRDRFQEMTRRKPSGHTHETAELYRRALVRARHCRERTTSTRRPHARCSAARSKASLDVPARAHGTRRARDSTARASARVVEILPGVLGTPIPLGFWRLETRPLEPREPPPPALGATSRE
jgi:hypothetical protein